MPEPKDAAPAEAPTKILALVREPFDGHAKGSSITDRAKLRDILDGPNAGHVVVMAPAK